MTFKLVKFIVVQMPLQWANHPKQGCGTWELSDESQNKWKKERRVVRAAEATKPDLQICTLCTLHHNCNFPLTQGIFFYTPPSPSTFPVPPYPSALAPTSFVPSPAPPAYWAGISPRHGGSEATRMQPDWLLQREMDNRPVLPALLLVGINSIPPLNSNGNFHF